MTRLLLLSTVQCVFLAATQVFLKLAMERMGKFAWTWAFFKSQLTNWHLLFSGICVVTATLLWMYILKHFPLSVAYPLISISYVFGMIASILIFHETVSISKWIGVALIMGGVFFLLRQ